MLTLRLPRRGRSATIRTTECGQRAAAIARSNAFTADAGPSGAAQTAETGCDGVHVGQQDTPYAEARALMGPDRILGVTCHASRDLAMEAAEAGADYVAFGAFFPTTTKVSGHRADIEILQWWAVIMTVPCVAIGGITPETAPDVLAAGADAVAMIGALVRATDPAAAVRITLARLTRR